MPKGPSVKNGFEWDDRRDRAAVMLAEARPKKEICEAIGISTKTLYMWEQNEDFSKEVDRLSLMLGTASKSNRLRLINKAIQQMIDENGKIDLTGVTFLELLKEARMQTEGLRLDIFNQIAAIHEETGFVVSAGSDGLPALPEPDQEETE